MPVAMLQQRMSSREFAEWVAEYKIRATEAEQAQMAARVEARAGG